MRTLALDLGTKTGFAYGDTRTGLAASGTWILATEKALREMRKTGGDRRHDIRFDALCNHVTEVIETHKIERIVFEDVQFLSSQAQSQLWASLRGAMWCATPPSGVETRGVPVGTLKKFFTGNGAAKKEDMAAALCSQFANYLRVKGMVVTLRDHRSVDDNEVDALALFSFAVAVDAGTHKWPE